MDIVNRYRRIASGPLAELLSRSSHQLSARPQLPGQLAPISAAKSVQGLPVPLIVVAER